MHRGGGGGKGTEANPTGASSRKASANITHSHAGLLPKGLHPVVTIFTVLGLGIALYTFWVTAFTDPTAHKGHHRSHAPTIPGGGPLSIPGLAQHRGQVRKQHMEEGELLRDAHFGGRNGRGTHPFHLGNFDFANFIHGLVWRQADVGKPVGWEHPTEESAKKNAGRKTLRDALDEEKKDPNWWPAHVYRKWFPSLFSSTSAKDFLSGDYNTCTIPPDRTKTMDNTRRRSYRIAKTLHPSLYNSKQPLKLEGIDDEEGNGEEHDDHNDANAAKKTSVGSRKQKSADYDVDGAHRIVYRHSLNDAVDLKFTLERYFALRGFKNEKDRESGLEQLRAKRLPYNPWVEARAAVVKYSSDVMAQWKKEQARHYGGSLMESANTMCTNLLDVKQALKEGEWSRNRRLATAISSLDELDELEADAEEAKEKKISAQAMQERKRNILGAAIDQELDKSVAESLLHLKSVHNEAVVGGVGVQRAASAPSPGATLAEQSALLSKVQVWDPVCSYQRLSQHATLAVQERGAAAIESVVVNRPVLLCLLTTTFRKLRLAVLQHQLWGSQCDEFLIFVADGHRHWDRKSKERFEKELAAMDTPLDSSRIVYLKASFGRDSNPELSSEEPVTLLGAQDDSLQWEEASLSDRTNQWQTHREVISFLSSWHMTPEFDFFFFGNEDTYLVPENLYEMLTLNPEYKIPHELGTALLLGNRMVVPATKQSFVSSSAGYVMNARAVNMRTLLLNHEDCEPTAVSDNDDVLLAKCLSVFGVVPRDTSDEYGQDRFTALNLEWLIRTAVDPSASWWYSSYRMRGLARANAGLEDMDSPGGRPAGGWSAYNAWSAYALSSGQYDPASNVAVAATSLSSGAISFAHVASPAKAVWLHEELFGLPPPPKDTGLF